MKKLLKYKNLSLTSLLLLFLFGNQVIYACGCKAQKDLNIMNLNDAELIFTGTLLSYKIGMGGGIIKFKPLKIFKGEPDSTVTFYFQLKTSHTLFNENVKFEEGKDWVVFARRKKVSEKFYYRFIPSGGNFFCALTRPLKEDRSKDSYLTYLVENSKQPDGVKNFYQNDDELFATGVFYENIPVQEWKYYDPDGRLNISGMYIDGLREEEWKKYTLNSKGESIVIQKRFYHQGELKEIHDLKYSGEITFKKFLSDSSEIRHYLFQNGEIKTITHRNLDDDTMKTMTYYENGVLREEKYFKGDKLMRKYVYDLDGKKSDEWIRLN